MLSRIGPVRVIEGAARETPVGGLLAFRAPSGDLYGVYRRLPDLPGQDGGIRVHSAEHVWTEAEIKEGVGVSHLDVFALDRYVRVEEIPEAPVEEAGSPGPVVRVRVIPGKASECPLGGLICFRYSDGFLGTIYRRMPDLPEEPGDLQFKRVDIKDGELWTWLPEDLDRHVCVEEVAS